MNCRPTNPPTPPRPLPERLTYKHDLKMAVERLEYCRDDTQVLDVLNSLEYFIKATKEKINA